MSYTDRQNLALEFFHRAYERQMRGEYEEAIDLYSRSIEAFPTAEAYTFRGWTYSFLGKLDKAISECLEAIRVDPGFGNPYNDIGAYLIEQGEWEEAIPWLEKATRAPRYEASAIPGSTWAGSTSTSTTGAAPGSATGRRLRPTASTELPW